MNGYILRDSVQVDVPSGKLLTFVRRSRSCRRCHALARHHYLAVDLLTCLVDEDYGTRHLLVVLAYKTKRCDIEVILQVTRTGNGKARGFARPMNLNALLRHRTGRAGRFRQTLRVAFVRAGNDKSAESAITAHGKAFSRREAYIAAIEIRFRAGVIEGRYGIIVFRINQTIGCILFPFLRSDFRTNGV